MRAQNTKLSFIVLPDTQKMTRHYPGVLEAMCRWIVGNAGRLGIGMVVHVGDVVDRGAEEEEEYRRSSAALGLMEEAGIPLLIAPGNHDYDVPVISTREPIPEEKRRGLAMFNQYFGMKRLQGKPWFGGSYHVGRSENAYAVIESGGTRFLFLILEFMPRPPVMEWADRVMREHRDRPAIVVTHSYMHMHGERVKAGDPGNPREKYASMAEGQDGEEMWQRHLRHHPNLIAVFSGHHTPIHVSHRLDCGVHGNRVLQCFQNWQTAESGGSGRFRLVDYDLEQGVLTARVFNPLTEQYEAEPGYELDCIIHFLARP